MVPRRDADDALIMYTSGSTGVPKGVRQTHRNTMAQVEAVIEVYELTAADHALLPMPLFHVGGLQLGTLPILLRGGQVTYMARWDAVAWIALAQRLRPSYGGLISTMLIDVGNRTVDAPVLLDSFRVLMFGGSRTPSAPIARLTAGTGVEPVEIYGQTEQSGLAATYRSMRAAATGPRAYRWSRSSRCGWCRPPVARTSRRARTRSASCGCAARPSRPATGTGRTATRRSGDDGWFRTGDLVSRDADGYLYYVDRIDDMIVTGGENVFPQMVEEHSRAARTWPRSRSSAPRTSGGWSRSRPWSCPCAPV